MHTETVKAICAKLGRHPDAARATLEALPDSAPETTEEWTVVPDREWVKVYVLGSECVYRLRCKQQISEDSEPKQSECEFHVIPITKDAKFSLTVTQEPSRNEVERGVWRWDFRLNGNRGNDKDFIRLEFRSPQPPATGGPVIGAVDHRPFAKALVHAIARGVDTAGQQTTVVAPEEEAAPTESPESNPGVGPPAP